MLNNKTVAVVISAYNEETQIHDVLQGIPDFVDRIVVVNDCSKDATAQEVLSFAEKKGNAGLSIATRRQRFKATRYNAAEAMLFDIFASEAAALTPFKVVTDNPDSERVILINHLENGGKGAAVATGYHFCREYGFDCTVTIDGDGQMDPEEMEKICTPIVAQEFDFVKGNRLSHRAASQTIPLIRYFGNSTLSILTKVASGYWNISDTQTGYTAISARGLEQLRLHRIYKRYGMPNDILVKLNIAGARLKEVDIKPVYGVGEQSKMKISKVVPRISLLLLKSFFKRLWQKYFFKSFHPLFLLYHFAFVLFGLSIPLVLLILHSLLIEGVRPPIGYYFALGMMLSLGLQSFLFAMWMDMQNSERFTD